MYSSDYIEGLMRSLTPTQLGRIQEEYVTSSPRPWVVFHVTVFNTGAVVSLAFQSSPEEIDPATWNGYDISIHIDDVVELLDTLLEEYEL